MKHVQKTRIIICVCMLLVGIFSGIAIVKAFRPSAGLPYEQLTMEKAEKYMSYEEGYQLVDVRSEEQFGQNHMEGAVNIPYDTLVEKALTILSDKQQMIYVYAEDSELSANACMKLCELGYTSISQITDWSPETGD